MPRAAKRKSYTTRYALLRKIYFGQHIAVGEYGLNLPYPLLLWLII